MELSKNIRHGTVCAWRSDKLICASRKTKRIAGIWNSASFIKMIGKDDKRREFKIPAGLRVQGEGDIAMATGIKEG